MPFRLDSKCPDCGSYVVTRTRRADGERFLSCSAYPECRWAGDYDEALQELAESYAQMIMEARSGRRDSGGISDALREIIGLARPDKFPADAQAQANAVTAALNALRENLT